MNPVTSEQAFELAISEAKKGFGYVAPNPPVGCVILDRDGRLLSQGYHHACGENHAEIDALEKIEDKSLLEGAHVFVTLEPCSFVGRTGSCAEALAELPVSTVIYGLEDPNPKVSGRGAEILRKAGKVVSQFNGYKQELEELIEIFSWNMKEKKPFFALKTATSLDGQLAMKSGESKWLTNSAARDHSHFLRACYDAVLVGRNTFLIDDPKLNVRHPQFSNFVNKVIVLDPKGQVLQQIADSNLGRSHSPENIYLVVEEAPNDEYPFQVLVCNTSDEGDLDLNHLAELLMENSITSVFVEGGAGTYHNFITQGLVNRIYQFIAPSIIGDEAGRTWTEKLKIKDLDSKLVLKNSCHFSFGDNILVTGLLK